MIPSPQPWHHCQGQIVCFSASAKSCKECPQNKEGALEVRSRLHSLQERIDVSKLLHGVQAFLDRKGVSRGDIKVELVSGAKPLIGKSRERFESRRDLSSLSVHARRIATAIEKSGIDMVADSKQGVNSFKTMKMRPGYLAEIQELLNKRRPFSRLELKLAIGRAVTLSPSSMNNTSSFVISALEALEVITQVGDGLYAPN